MRAKRRMTIERFREILRRQDPPAFGKDYEPSIKALTAEAPPGSNNGRIWSEVIQREIHFLSRPEELVVPILLYCPLLFDLQEQRMLPFLPAQHPLEGHPRAARMLLPSFRGTLEITEELGAIHIHPVVSTAKRDSRPLDIDVDQVPGCWIGDFLMFLEDEVGPYNVNINVKKTQSDFDLPEIEGKSGASKNRARFRQKIRQDTEEILYRDVGIRTVRVAANQLNKIMVNNLLHLATLQRRRSGLTAEQESDVIAGFRETLEFGDPPLKFAHHLRVHEKIPIEDAQTVFYRAIFQRKLRVDLYEPILFDHPLNPESKDVLSEYQHWFRRTGP